MSHYTEENSYTLQEVIEKKLPSYFYIDIEDVPVGMVEEFAKECEERGVDIQLVWEDVSIGWTVSKVYSVMALTPWQMEIVKRVARRLLDRLWGEFLPESA